MSGSPQFKYITAGEAHQQAIALHGANYTGEEQDPVAGEPDNYPETGEGTRRPVANDSTRVTDTKRNKRATRKVLETVDSGRKRNDGTGIDKRITRVVVGDNPQRSGSGPRMNALQRSFVTTPLGADLPPTRDQAEGASNSLHSAYRAAGYTSDLESPTDKAQAMIDFVKVKKEYKSKGRIPGDFQTPTVEAPVEGVRHVNKEELIDSLKDGSIRYSKQTKDKDGNPSIARGAFAGLSARQIASDPRLRRLARIANGTHTPKDLVDAQADPDSVYGSQVLFPGTPKNIPTTDQPRGARNPNEVRFAEGSGPSQRYPSLFEHVQKHGVMFPITIDRSGDTPKITDGLKRIAAANAIDPNMKIPYKEA